MLLNADLYLSQHLHFVVLLICNCVSTWQPPVDGGKVEKIEDSRNMETVLLSPQLHGYQGAQIQHY